MLEMELESRHSNGAKAPSPRSSVTPEVDLYESHTEYLLRIDVPGAKAESIDIQVSSSELRLTAEQAPAAIDAEAPVAAFERRVELPAEVDAKSATAHLADGVLEIRIAKSAAARVVKIPVRSAN